LLSALASSGFVTPTNRGHRATALLSDGTCGARGSPRFDRLETKLQAACWSFHVGMSGAWISGRPLEKTGIGRPWTRPENLAKAVMKKK
jgi:hypothetical protein